MTKEKQSRNIISVELPDDLWAYVHEGAEEDSISINGFIRMDLRRCMKRKAKSKANDAK